MQSDDNEMMPVQNAQAGSDGDWTRRSVGFPRRMHLHCSRDLYKARTEQEGQL